MSRTVLILHPGGFGDLLLAVPAIRALRERFPSHTFILCAQAQAAEFLHECGVVDQWISAQTTACTALFGGTVPDDPLLRDWLNRCELAVAWTHDEGGTLAVALKASGVASAVVHSPFASSLASIHQSDRFAEIVGVQLGRGSMVPLPVPDTLRAEAEASLAALGVPRRRSLAMVHPGSGSRHKCVKPEILLPVLKGLDAQGLEPVLLEGPADHEVVERLLAHMTCQPILLSGLSIRVLAGVLAQVELFLGHDSGVTHLAALLGAPTVALFGPTDPARWAARGPTVTVLRGQLCQCDSWDRVRQCMEKPCLELAPLDILQACRMTRANDLNPRIC